MRKVILSAIVPLSVVVILGSVQPAAAQFYTQHNLVSDGFVSADHPDPNMVNAWGLVSGPATPWWIADNGSGRTTLYN
ncbi:MAG: TIGR03118 family protein, partial [Betaproteobacteria bacterium]